MNTKIQVLKADIEAEEAEIAKIFGKLEQYPSAPEDEAQAIVAAYYLHNLYTAFEQIGMLVAQAFENQIENRSQWHALLLRRMALNIEGIRPRLFRDETYACLDELRGFRHVFRSAYKVTLDPERLRLVSQKAERLKGLYEGDLALFKRFLDSLG